MEYIKKKVFFFVDECRFFQYTYIHFSWGLMASNEILNSFPKSPIKWKINVNFTFNVFINLGSMF